MGCGFTLTLFVMASIREILGTGTWYGMPVPWFSENPIAIFTMAPGGFFVFGVLIAAAAALSKGKKPARKAFGCVGCPSAAACGACGKEEKV